MRAISFRVEDDLYVRIQEEAEQQDLSASRVSRRSPARFSGASAGGAPWADYEAWGEALDVIQEIEHRDITARAKLATERRTGRTFREKLERERQHAGRDQR
jgi:predicted transcriptional regulator